MSAITVNTQAWPIVVVTFPPQFSDEEWAMHVKDIYSLADRAQQSKGFAVVVDLRRSQTPTAKQRQEVANIWAEATNRGIHLHRLGHVIENPILRGVITAITWVQAPKWEVAFFPTLEKAQAWVREGLV